MRLCKRRGLCTRGWLFHPQNRDSSRPSILLRWRRQLHLLHLALNKAATRKQRKHCGIACGSLHFVYISFTNKMCTSRTRTRAAQWPVPCRGLLAVPVPVRCRRVGVSSRLVRRPRCHSTCNMDRELRRAVCVRKATPEACCHSRSC